MSQLPSLSPASAVQGFCLLTVLAGFSGLLLRRNLFLKVLGLDVMSTGVISVFVLLAARGGLLTPILTTNPDGASDTGFADPIPQAVILTAIVIGFSVQALLLVVVTHLSRRNPTLRIEALEEADRG